jgi:hypothetical protein
MGPPFRATGKRHRRRADRGRYQDRWLRPPLQRRRLYFSSQRGQPMSSLRVLSQLARCSSMSELGQTPSLSEATAMSTSPPKADLLPTSARSAETCHNPTTFGTLLLTICRLTSRYPPRQVARVPKRQRPPNFPARFRPGLPAKRSCVVECNPSPGERWLPSSRMDS